MTSRTKLWALSAGALALSLALAGCGGGGSSSSGAASPASGGSAPPVSSTQTVALHGSMDLMAGTTVIMAGASTTVGDTTVTCPAGGDDCELTVTKDEVTGHYSATSTGGMASVAVVKDFAAGSVALEAREQMALASLVPMPGNTAEIAVPAGMKVVREGVTFECMSDYDCTVTVMNEAGTVVASMMTRRLGYEGDAPTLTAMIDPDDPLRELNRGLAGTVDTTTGTNSTGIAGIVHHAIAGAPTGHASDNPSAYDNGDIFIGGMAMDGVGNRNAHLGPTDFDGLALTGPFDPNGEAFDYDPNASPLVAPEGSVLMPNAANRSVPGEEPFGAGWMHHVLFSDWGDTSMGGGDGGYETGGVVVSNIEGPMAHSFATLNTLIADDMVRELFMLDEAADGTAGTTSVSIDTPGTGTAATAVQMMQTNAMVFSSESLVGAQSQDLLVDQFETFRGTYFGAAGQYQCTVVQPDGCALQRNEDGTVRLWDRDSTVAGIQAVGSWTFTPDEGETVEVPDQDWILYGAWLTTPDDNTTGEHRVGVFFDGMDTYGNGTFDAMVLTGEATYNGSATGIYVDRARTGLFTADATLKADFGMATEAGMIEGRIDNFRNTNGDYLGLDTAANPNDPTAGGENDWVVLLTSTALPTSATNAVVAGMMPTGSADGVDWDNAQWNYQLYGGGDRLTTPAHPSGVAGTFRAITPDLDPGAGEEYKGVVGAFGAMKEEDGS